MTTKERNQWMGIMVLCLGLFLIQVCQAQVNFSTGWGKRDSATPQQCKPPLYTLSYIINILQMEIDKLIECSKIQ